MCCRLESLAELGPELGNNQIARRIFLWVGIQDDWSTERRVERPVCRTLDHVVLFCIPADRPMQVQYWYSASLASPRAHAGGRQDRGGTDTLLHEAGVCLQRDPGESNLKREVVVGRDAHQVALCG